MVAKVDYLIRCQPLSTGSEQEDPSVPYSIARDERCHTHGAATTNVTPILVAASKKLCTTTPSKGRLSSSFPRGLPSYCNTYPRLFSAVVLYRQSKMVSRTKETFPQVSMTASSTMPIGAGSNYLSTSVDDGIEHDVIRRNSVLAHVLQQPQRRTCVARPSASRDRRGEALLVWAARTERGVE